MPKKQAQGIDVSAEEERYLRKVFRRFAIPYVVAFAALVGVGFLLGGSGGGGASSESLLALEQEVEQLRATVAALEARLGSVGDDLERAGGRVAALEQQKKDAAKTADPALEQKVSDATRRVNDLEKKLADQAVSERFDALAARMTKIEGQARASLATSPTAPVAPPAAPTPGRLPAP
jgi:hypothetical protein